MSETGVSYLLPSQESRSQETEAENKNTEYRSQNSEEEKFVTSRLLSFPLLDSVF
jgi:hypothetical protein